MEESVKTESLVNEGNTIEAEISEAAKQRTAGFAELLGERSGLDAAQYSPLVLAYIGDAAYELAIRSRVVEEANMQVNKMHKKTTQFVKAETQAKMIMVLEEMLTPEEHAVYKRGRNAKAATMAKNASMKDYRMATGFEAVIGYLYLNSEFARMMELIDAGLAGILEEKAE